MSDLIVCGSKDKADQPKRPWIASTGPQKPRVTHLHPVDPASKLLTLDLKPTAALPQLRSLRLPPLALLARLRIVRRLAHPRRLLRTRGFLGLAFVDLSRFSRLAGSERLLVGFGLLEPGGLEVGLLGRLDCRLDFLRGGRGSQQVSKCSSRQEQRSRLTSQSALLRRSNAPRSRRSSSARSTRRPSSNRRTSPRSSSSSPCAVEPPAMPRPPDCGLGLRPDVPLEEGPAAAGESRAASLIE